MPYDDEFPLLRLNGLYASEISGDGDCLFHALSDQLYGHENNHLEIRSRVVNHMRQHSSYFKSFLDVEAISGNKSTVSSNTRSRSKKNNNSKKEEKYTPAPDHIVDQAFRHHLELMSKSGVYGDNMEICAFAREYDIDVKIYQRDFAYVVAGGDEGASRKLLHIAYHTWEHYSSVRNLAGPHTGLPNVCPIPPTTKEKEQVEKKLKETSHALPWMITTVEKSLPYLATTEKIRKALEECKGNVNEAVGKLLDEEYAEEHEEEREGGKQGKAMEDSIKAVGEEKKNKEGINDVNENNEHEDKGIATDIEYEKKVGEASTTSIDNKTLPVDVGKIDAGEDKAAQDEKQTREPGKDGEKQVSTLTESSPPKKGESEDDKRNLQNPGDRKQSAKKPKRETAREKKERRKQAAHERKKGSKSVTSTKDTPSPAVSSGIKELYI